jgi:hypothetical protein
VDVFFFVPSMCSELPFFSLIFVLLELVVVAVSVLLAQEAKKATPTRTVMEERIDLFIGEWGRAETVEGAPKTAR